MKTVITTAAIWLAFFLVIAVSYDEGESFCVIFPQNGRDIFGVEQRAIMIFGEDEVSLIPQINFEGDALDFGILVPVPSEPSLTTVGANIFSEASFMTQPVVRRGSGGCGCDEDNAVMGPIFAIEQAGPGARVDEDASGGVTIVFEDVVGTFQAVVLQATDVTALTDWLTDNDYRFDPADSEVLAEYVAQNWFFIAMKLDPSQVPPHIDPWWSAVTSPARITFAYSAESLTYPLKISSISTKDKAEVLVYTIGPEPMRFDKAGVEYANAISSDELDAIAERYPTLYGLIAEGSFMTKLRRSFTKAEMKEDIEIFPTDDRSEFREVRYVNNSEMGLAAIFILLTAFLINMKRRKKAS